MFLASSHLFALARQGKRLTNVFAAVPLAVVFFLLGAILGAIPLFVVFGQAIADGSFVGAPLETAAISVAQFVLTAVFVMLFLWLWLHFYERRRFQTLGFERPSLVPKYLRGLLIGVLLYSAALGISAALGYVSYEVGDPAQQGTAALGGVLLAYLGWMFQGPTEEVIFRGWLMPVIGARYRPWIGVAVSSVAFAALHLANSGVSLLAVVNLVLFGVFAALFALWEGGLWGVAAIHSAWNWAQGNVFGIEVSGSHVAGGILYNLQQTGPDVITGGAFGSEGGLPVTIVLLVACGAMLALLRRNAASTPTV